MPDLISLAGTIGYVGLGLAMLLAVIRVLRGPSLADRVVAFDLFAGLGVALAAIYTVIERSTVFLDVAIVIALVSFIGTVAFARYLEKGSLRR